MADPALATRRGHRIDRRSPPRQLDRCRGGAATQRSGARMAVRLDPKHDAWQNLPPAPVDLDTPAALALTDHAVLVVAPSFANGSIGAPSKALILDPIGAAGSPCRPVRSPYSIHESCC